MEYTESQKREALEWADNNDMAYDCCAHSRVLAHFLRLAESELAEARRENATWKECFTVFAVDNGTLNLTTIDADKMVKTLAELSALRAENEALKKMVVGGGFDEGVWRHRAEAALAEALTHKEVWSNQFKKVCDERDSALAANAENARLATLNGQEVVRLTAENKWRDEAMTKAGREAGVYVATIAALRAENAALLAKIEKMEGALEQLSRYSGDEAPNWVRMVAKNGMQ